MIILNATGEVVERAGVEVMYRRHLKYFQFNIVHVMHANIRTHGISVVWLRV